LYWIAANPRLWSSSPHANQLAAMQPRIAVKKVNDERAPRLRYDAHAARVDRFISELSACSARMRARVTPMSAYITGCPCVRPRERSAISTDWRDMTRGRRSHPRDPRDYWRHRHILQRNPHRHVA
jgi:hypothetical protein